MSDPEPSVSLTQICAFVLKFDDQHAASLHRVLSDIINSPNKRAGMRTIDVERITQIHKLLNEWDLE